MRLAIVDSNPEGRENLRRLLAGESGISVIGAFESGKKALKGLSGKVPDVVVLDLELPDMPGADLIRTMKAGMPKLDVLVYTALDDWKSVFSALKAGATGYLLKRTRPKDLIEAIAGVYEGGAPLSPKVAGMVITEFHERNGGGREWLSTRQVEILNGMDRGLTYREIAKGLRISPLTVRTHIRNIYEKLGASSKADAIRKARREGCI